MQTAGTLDPAADVVRYYHTDAIGSVRVLTDATAQVLHRYDYKPFGVEWNAGEGGQTRRFTGQERDVEAGLDYFGARFYASGNGRFTSVDPQLDAETALITPQRWNRYSYVGNRPLNIVDPDGRNWIHYLSRLGTSQPVQRAQQVVASHGLRTWNALTRWFNSPEVIELVETAAELTTGASLGSASTAKVGAVIGHADAGYASVGHKLGVAVFDIKTEIWKQMTPVQRIRANEAFLDGLVQKRVGIQIITSGFVRPNSTLHWEIEYLLGKGYKFSKDGKFLFPE
jgi:RHS repeat-associated protein